MTDLKTRVKEPAWRYCVRWLERNQTALLVILVAFVGRLLIAGTNSYWLDEIYSVYIHATRQSSTADVIDSMWGIIHPPLYQIVLFHWIGIFGDSEVATRTLSNVFITLASFFLYLLARDSYGVRVALAVLIVFSMMAIPVHYALETRSYAMAIMWASASSWAMRHFLASPPMLRPWRSFVVDRYFLILVAVNTAAIFTHYYMAFFVAAQGAFILFHLALRHDVWKKPWELLRLSVVGIVPPSLLLSLWGGSMVERYRKGGRFSADEDSPNFIEAFYRTVVQPNLESGSLLVVLLGLFALVYLLRSVMQILRRRKAAFRAYMTFYIAVWLAGPLAVAFVVLKLVDQDAYGERYFAFVSPALALLLVLGAFELVRVVARTVKKVAGPDLRRMIYPLSGAFAVLLAAATVLPQGYATAAKKKHDWRLIAELVAETINSDNKHSYIVYDTGWRQKIFDYYLAKQEGDLGVTRTVNAREERKKTFPSRAQRRQIREHDYIVLVFTHLPSYRYKNTLRNLNKRYEEAYRVLSSDSRGYIVYRVRSQ